MSLFSVSLVAEETVDSSAVLFCGAAMNLRPEKRGAG